MPPAIVSRTLNLRHWAQIGFDHRFQIGRTGCSRSQAGFECLGSQVIENDSPTFEHSSEEAFLAAEMVVSERDVDVSHGRDFPQGDSVIAMFSEQYLGGVKNAPFAGASFDHDSALLPTKIGHPAKIGHPLMRAGLARVKRPTQSSVNSA